MQVATDLGLGGEYGINGCGCFRSYPAFPNFIVVEKPLSGFRGFAARIGIYPLEDAFIYCRH